MIENLNEKPEKKLVFSSNDADSNYISPTPGEIPVMLSSPCSEWVVPMKSDFTRALDCGANSVIVGNKRGNMERIRAAFEAAKGTGIKIIMHQDNMDEMWFMKCVKEYKDNPLLGAWKMKDEPNYFNWHDFKKQSNDEKMVSGSECDITPEYCGYVDKEAWHTEDLRPVYEKIREEDPNHMVFFTLAVTYDKCRIGCYKTYESYLEAFERTFRPPVWMFDYYPVTGSDENWNVHYSDFYKWFLIFLDMSQKTKRPFWYYCQSVSYKYKGIVVFPTPTEEMLRWEAFTALAFGAKGIAYYRYTMGEDTDNTKYLSAPINREGEKTPVWYAMQTVNGEIRKYSNSFLNSDVIKIYSVGLPHDGLPAMEESGEYPYGPLLGILCNDGRGILFSHLKNKTVNMFIIVNKSVTEKVSFRLAFDKNQFVFYRGGGGILSRRPVDAWQAQFENEEHCVLEPGGYIIFENDERDVTGGWDK